MSAPERIFTEPQPYDFPGYSPFWAWHAADELEDAEGLVEYVRSDLHTATLARAERAEALLAVAKAEQAKFAEANHRQALCITFTASALGPECSGTIDALPKAARHVREERDALRARLAEAVEALRTLRDYVDDASRGTLRYRGQSDISEMAGQDLVFLDTTLARIQEAKP